MDRRSFLKSTLLGSLGLILPIELSSELVIVDTKLSDDFSSILKIESGKDYINVTVETDNILNYVILIDEDDREWTTQDNGKTWHCGLMSFDLDVD